MNKAKAKQPTPHKTPIVRAVIIDDHPLMRQALIETFRDHLPGIEICGEAGAQNEAVGLLRQTEPDLAIVDLTLDQGHGIELIKQVRHLMPDLRILVLSLHNESVYAERAIRAGANGYVCKSADPMTIVDAVRRVLDGQTYLSDQMIDRVVEQVAGAAAQPPATVDGLSDRELEVFEMLGKGLSTREIAERMNLSMKTVDVYRQRIKAKLEIESSSELMRRAVCHVMEHL